MNTVMNSINSKNPLKFPFIENGYDFVEFKFKCMIFKHSNIWFKKCAIATTIFQKVEQTAIREKLLV
jgi:hypothetical protein